MLCMVTHIYCWLSLVCESYHQKSFRPEVCEGFACTYIILLSLESVFQIIFITLQLIKLIMQSLSFSNQGLGIQSCRKTSSTVFKNESMLYRMLCKARSPIINRIWNHIQMFMFCLYLVRELSYSTITAHSNTYSTTLASFPMSFQSE